FHGHHVGDVDRAYYRSKEEEAGWKRERDPIALLADRLTSEAGVGRDTLERIDREVAAAIQAAVEHALEAPFPDPREVDEHVHP
ncbi:MAG: thiamine pyrophosphate-dependent enzyme, partial [Gaiellaceae bacterium]